MELYFLRHATAADPQGPTSTDDSQRPLTPQGIEEMTKAIPGMKTLGVHFDTIISSPFERAKRTAQIVMDGYDFKGTVRYSDALVPGANYPAFKSLLKELANTQSVLLVGHLPSAGVHISQLLSGTDEMAIDLKKGSLCRVDVTDSRSAFKGELKYLVSVKLMKYLGLATKD